MPTFVAANLISILVFVMRALFYLFLTCFISMVAFMSALKQPNIFPGYIVGFGVWALFILWYSRRSKKAAQRRSMERTFEEYMRMNLRRHQR